MIDNLKLNLINTCANTLRSLPILTFYSSVDISTGEIRTINKKGFNVMPYEYAYFKGLTIKIYSNERITISGSLHKYYNEGEHNANDFNFKAFLGVVEDLNQSLGVLPQNCILRSLEVGINFIPTIEIETLIKNSFLHRKKRGIECISYDKGNYKQFEHSQYYIKLYDKSKQYHLETPLVRFEIKYLKMKKVNDLGYYSLQDLVQKGLKPFKKILINELDAILYFDNTIKSDSSMIDKFNNPLYWQDLASNTKRSSFYKKQLSKLKELTKIHSENTMNDIRQSLINKIDELLS